MEWYKAIRGNEDYHNTYTYAPYTYFLSQTNWHSSSHVHTSISQNCGHNQSFLWEKSLASANFHVVTGYCLGKWSWVYDQKRSRVHSKKKMQPCGKTLVHTGASLIFEYYYFSSIIWDLPAECYQSFNPCTIILVKVPHLHIWKDTLKHKCMVSGVLVISVISLAL